MFIRRSRSTTRFPCVCACVLVCIYAGPLHKKNAYWLHAQSSATAVGNILQTYYCEGSCSVLNVKMSVSSGESGKVGSVDGRRKRSEGADGTPLFPPFFFGSRQLARCCPCSYHSLCGIAVEYREAVECVISLRPLHFPFWSLPTPQKITSVLNPASKCRRARWA